MKRGKAIDLYLKHTVHAPFTIRRLMLWNPELDLTQNAKRFKDGANNRTALQLAKKFNLRYVDGREK